MPSTLTIVRQRRHRRQAIQRSGQQRSQRAVLALGFAVSGLLLVGLVMAALVYAALTSGLPPAAELPILLNPQDGLLLQPTRFYDRTGQHLLASLAPSPEKRSYIPYDQFPPALVEATVALAEPDFWHDSGVLLAGWQDAALHPTLAQKLVSDLLLWDEAPSTARAIHERLLAAQVTARYGRQQVLEWYLNSADYGHYAYGAEAAARLYFGKSVRDLDLSEAALLAAVSQAPALNPIDAPQAAALLRLQTLEVMKAQGLVTPDQADQAVSRPPAIQPYSAPADLAPAFVNLALDQLAERFDRSRLTHGGLDVITTLDFDLQMQTACAARTQLARLAGNTDAIPAQDGSACTAARLLSTLPAGVQLPDASASVLVLDPHSGQVLAAVGDLHGGRESPRLASHPAGTLVTPFIYLTGFTRGLNPADLGWDIPSGAPVPGAQYHGPVRLRIAMVNDYLAPATHVLDQMGADSVDAIARSFGLEIPSQVRLLQDDFSLAPLDAAGAYGIFADGGNLVGQRLSDSALHPFTLLKVAGADHSVWLDWSTPQEQAVVSPQLAYLMNQVLSDETARWPSLGRPNPLEIGRPAGVKVARMLAPASGGGLDASTLWVVGYTPQRAAVVWFSAGGSPGTGNDASRLAAGLWHGVMLSAVASLPSASWDMPSGVTTVEVCDPSGLLPTPACPNVVAEVFLAGREPVQSDSLYQTMQVNRETGLLATVFTPPELVEARVYMLVPAEARQWAQSAGIQAPPTAYDTVQVPPPLPGAHITAPAMFSDAHGQVAVIGSAAGADFVSYRLEYGQGLNPQAWVLIGADSRQAVEEGPLASWDTQGLDGLYALRLLVVHSDQHIDQAVVLVTVDNTPPQVTVTYPQEGQAISAAQEPQVALQAQVSDAFVVKVEFYVDDGKVGEFTAGPFGLLWPAAGGKHTFRVVAIDRAGNRAEAAVDFTVNP